MQVALWVTAQECLGMSTLSCFRYPLYWGPTQTDWLSITSPKISSPWHLHCSFPCPQPLSFTRPAIAIHQLLPTSCQSPRLLLCSCWRSRTCSTRLYVLLGSVLLQYDPQHHFSSPLITTITYVIGITGELTSTLLLLVNTVSCCCSLFYKVSSDLLSTQVSTSSSMITFVLRTAQHKLVLLIRSRGESWSEETQSHLRIMSGFAHWGPTQRCRGWQPLLGPDTLSLGWKRSVEMFCCGTMPKRLIPDFCFLFC